ncbi:acylphosphatase [Gaeumannomyces tritici R3-111a-1]|uniref:acylphosphatase n=1 Tax=Gaeumannomyces tritici (strain R3-111a-1) TaxID=644352 RepID=J3NKQ4_GAET3|nr:acylphosphatase [Gaeumannomyces tritici R3-111a-1]EJT81871.1 acylphosphatase [Gaeumannomyces tritici R3-111a-1]
MAIKRVYFLAHGGAVQGVGFRYFTRKQAVQHEITGWVRNTPNNKVEGEAQGEEAALSVFLKDVDKGPRGAHVARLDKEDRDVVDGEAGFEIRH